MIIVLNLDHSCTLRDHPFNLKGGGGGYGFFSDSKYFVSLRGAVEFFFCDIIFFYKNNVFLRHKVLSEYLFTSKLPTEILFQRKPHIPPPPPFPLQVKWWSGGSNGFLFSHNDYLCVCRWRYWPLYLQSVSEWWTLYTFSHRLQTVFLHVSSVVFRRELWKWWVLE